MDRSLDEIISERPVGPLTDSRYDHPPAHGTRTLTLTHSQRVADHLHPALVPAEVPHRRGLRAGRSIPETAYERYVKYDPHRKSLDQDARSINHQQLTGDIGASSSLLSLNADPPLPSSCDNVVQHAFEPRAPDDAGEVSGGGLR